MTSEIVERVRRSARYRGVDPALVARLAAEELPRARNADDAVKRVKRRLHQAVGAFRRTSVITSAAGDGRAAAIEAMRRHASTRERLPYLDRFYGPIWEAAGRPRTVLDLGCGLHPLGLPWMGIEPVNYVAVDVDGRVLETIASFFGAIGQPGRAEARDLVTDPPREPADVAFLLKLVTTLDRQDPDAASRLLAALDVGHAVVSFASRSLGGRSDRRASTYGDRLERLLAESGRLRALTEVSIPSEIAWVASLAPRDG